MDNNSNIQKKPVDLKMLEYYDKLMKEALAEVLNNEVITATNVVSDSLEEISTNGDDGAYDDGLFHVASINIIMDLLKKIDMLEERLELVEDALQA